jgi:hypothetical protein
MVRIVEDNKLLIFPRLKNVLLLIYLCLNASGNICLFVINFLYSAMSV